MRGRIEIGLATAADEPQLVSFLRDYWRAAAFFVHPARDLTMYSRAV